MSIPQLIRDLKLDLTVTAVKRRLYKAGLKGYHPCKKPILSLNHRLRRQAWARQWRCFDFSSVLFTDEKKWVRVKSSGQWVWRFCNERYHPKCMVPKIQGGGGSLMVWGAITKTHTYPLIRIEETLDGPKFKELLTNFFPPVPGSSRSTLGRNGNLPWIFQQDNASVHTSKIVQEYLAERKASILPWPALSPDLSPIENLWGIVSRRVYLRNYQTVEELWEGVQAEWNAVSPDLLASLYDSMPRRCEAVLKAHGYPTKY